MPIALLPATAANARAIAALHTESWRSAYRGLISDDYLAGPIVDERRNFWQDRLAEPDDGRLVLMAVDSDGVAGFTCVLRDADPAWGPLLDNLHVRPDRKGAGIGRDLFNASREWSAVVAPGRPMHLWVLEGNIEARRFYDRQGGAVTGHATNELVPGIQVTAIRYSWKALA
jgi:GNAT superfamily N-acetyltransferase